MEHEKMEVEDKLMMMLLLLLFQRWAFGGRRSNLGDRWTTVGLGHHTSASHWNTSASKGRSRNCSCEGARDSVSS